jgi:hypothetical protein
MRPILVLLFLSASFAVAQPKPPQKTASASKPYPVWWRYDPHNTKPEDVEARLARPFAGVELDDLRPDPEAANASAQPDVHNCNELLALINPNDYQSPNRFGTRGALAAWCAEVRELGHAIPARRSAIRNITWTRAVFSLLPAGIYAAESEASHLAAVEAGNKGLSLSGYWRGTNRAQINHGFGLDRQTIYVPSHGTGLADADAYIVSAMGDFVGDGWDDIMIEASWGPADTLYGPKPTIAAYLLTRRSVNDRFRIVKNIF